MSSWVLQIDSVRSSTGVSSNQDSGEKMIRTTVQQQTVLLVALNDEPVDRHGHILFSAYAHDLPLPDSSRRKFWIFIFHKGSVAIRSRCGEILNGHYIAKLLEYLLLKYFLYNRSIFGEGIDKNMMSPFLTHHVIFNVFVSFCWGRFYCHRSLENVICYHRFHKLCNTSTLCCCYYCYLSYL